MGQNLELGIKLKFDGKEVEGGISVSREQLRGFKKELEGAVKPADVLGQSLGKVGKYAAGAFSVGAAIGFADAVVQAGLAAEKLNRQLAFSAGSTAAAAQELAYLRKTTNELGLDFATAAAAYGKLAAASKGTALQGQETRNVFEAVAKASTVMGLTAGETEGALLAVQQMISKGTVSAEELRGQLGERLPGAFQIAARAMNVTTAELGKMLEQGQIATSEFLPRFAAELTKTLGDAPQSAAASAQANINRMKSAWEDFKTSLANSGVLDAVANSVRVLAAGLNSVNPGELAKVARLQAEIANLELVRSGQRESGEDDFYTNKRITELRREIIAIQDKGKAERDAAQAAAERRASADRAAQNDLDREMQRGRQTDPDRLAAMQASAETALKAWGDSKHGTKIEENASKLAGLAKEYEAAYRAALNLGKSEKELAQIVTDYQRRAAEINKGPGSKPHFVDDASTEAAKDYAKAIEALTGIEAKATGTTKDLTAAEQVRENLIVSGAWDKLAPATREVVDTYVAAANAALHAASAEKIYSDAIKTQIAPLEQRALMAEQEVANYGLTAGRIEATTLARLEEARAIAAANDALPEHLAFLDREIEARKRIAAAVGTKDALDANKKATEEMQRDWERMHEQLAQSLTDELMKGGQDAGELLERYFKTLVLRPIIQGAVSIGMSTVAGALGINTGGASGGGGAGGGGISNLLSLGSNISSLGGISAGYAGFATSGIGSALGLGSATAAGYSAPVFASALEGGALLSAGSGTAAGGLSSLGAGIGTALPWIGGAIAIASILGAFGKNKVAPIEWGLRDTPLAGYNLGGGWDGYGVQGPFTRVTTLGQHLSRNGQSPAGLKTAVTDPVVALDNILAGYLSATEKVNVSMGLMLGNEGEQGWSQAAVEGIMMRRLNRISDAIGGWVDKLADTTTGTLQDRYTQLAQILSIRGDENMEQLANDMFNATGQWNYDRFTALQAGVQNFNALFLNDTDQLERYSEAMRKAFESLNISLPESRDGFKELVEGIDTSTKSGFDLYATLLDLSPTMDAYYQALKSELDVKGQLAAMTENHFTTAVDYTRYQRISGNYDDTFAGDYAYNIQRGAIQPGAAGNGDIVSEIRALRADQRARDIALASATQYTADTLRRWNIGGMPEVRPA